MNPADTAAKRSNEFFYAICPLYAHTHTHTYVGYIITTPPTVYSHTVRRKLNLLLHVEAVEWNSILSNMI